MELAEKTQIIARDRITLALVAEFMKFSLAKKNLELQETQLTWIKKQFQTAAQEYYQGLKTQRDHLRFKTQVGRGEIDVLSSRNALLRSKQELIRLLGIADPRADLDFIPLALTDEISFAETKMAASETVRFSTLQLQDQIEDKSLELTKKTEFPTVTLSAGSNYTNSNYLNSTSDFSDHDGLSWNLLLTLNYKIFDRGIQNRNYQVAAEKSQIAKNGMQSQRLSLASELEQRSLQRQQSLANFKLARDLQRLERKNRELIEVDYRNGRVYFLDFITVLSNDLDAQNKLVNVVYDSEFLRYTLLSYQGQLFEKLIR